MATGGKGIHVVVPLTPKHGWDEHRDFAEAMARMMADGGAGALPRQDVEGQAQGPDLRRLSAQRPRRDGDLALLDAGARRRLVASPVSWQQLARLKDAHPASIEDARKLLKADPWPDYEQVKQALPLDKLAQDCRVGKGAKRRAHAMPRQEDLGTLRFAHPTRSQGGARSLAERTRDIAHVAAPVRRQITAVDVLMKA